MVYMMHRYSNLLHKITRVLNFGRFKGRTIWEVYHDNPGYLAWCGRSLGKPFMDALTPRERHLVYSDTEWHHQFSEFREIYELIN